MKKFFIIFIILGIIVFSYNNIWQTYKTYISVYQSFQSYLPTNEIETIMNKTIQGKEPFNNVMQQYMSEQVYNSLSLNQNINNKVRIINQVLDTNNSDIVYINFFTFTKNSLGYIVYINQIMAIKKHDQWYLLENLSSHQVNDSWYYKVGDAIYIQHINSYHSQLKRFMRGFNGVSTKYLNNYLVWNNLVNYAKESDMEKRNIFLTFVLATLKTAKCRDLSNRPAVPLVA